MANEAASSESEGPVAASPDAPGELPNKRTPQGWQEFWDREVGAAEKRLRKFHKKGNRINQRFLDERADEDSDGEDINASGDKRLNLFHKNTKTLMSMLYGSTPRAEVAREHHDPDDDAARVASLMFKRILESDIEASGEDFSTALRAALQDYLVPGQGLCRVRYAFKKAMQQIPALPGGTPMEVEVIVDENAPIEYVHWQDFVWGWCRTWAEMPWQGFAVYVTREEAEERFDAKIAAALEYKAQDPSGDELQDRDERNSILKAKIWELWHKTERKVFWYAKGQPAILDQKADPLKLKGFWPTPRPMTANLTTSKFMPRANFLLAQDQYNEIDTLQTRISMITTAIKVVGVYDATEESSVGRMLNEGTENQLIPVNNWAMFAEKGGLNGAIDWYPVQEVAGVLKTLIAVRDQTIQLLYEVTGMSDIMRGGNTDQYTSDGTNQLKAKMGSIDIQALQDDFARFASDLEALKVEVIAKHFQPKSILKQSNASYLPQVDHRHVPAALELMKSPDIRWRVNIKPESIAMIDYAQLKSERSEFLTAMATYIQSAQAAAKTMPGSIPLLVEMMKWAMAGFKGSDYLEGTMDALLEEIKKNPPQDQDQNGDQAKMQAEQMKMQGEMQKLQAKIQGEMQLQQMKTGDAMKLEQQEFQNKLQLENQGHQNEMRKMITDLQGDLRIIAQKFQADMALEQQQSTMAAAEETISHDNRMDEIEANDRGGMD